MSVPGLNPAVPPAPAPAPIPPQTQPPRPGSPTLRNRPAQQHEQTQEDAASERGLKRDRPAEAEAEGMDIEISTEPALKRRRSEGEAATPERLQALIDAGDESSLRALLQQAPELLDTCYPKPILEGLTPLCYAASKGLEAMVRCLLDCNASAEATPDCGKTPLMFACEAGHLKIAKILKSKGADLATKNFNGSGCLHFAASHNRAEVIDWLLSEGVPVDEPGDDRMTPLMLACQAGHLRAAKILQSKDADLSAKCIFGSDCLNLAAFYNQPEVADWLLSLGVSVDEPGYNGMTPLMFASERGHLKVVQILLSTGANPAIKDVHGDSCLHLAANRNRYAVVEFLLSKGVPVDEPGRDGMTPLMHACQTGYLEVAQLLQRRGANLAAQDDEGRNCLHFAARFDQSEMIDWLLSNGMPVDQADSYGTTPLMSACAAGCLSAAKLLLSKGAKVAAKNSDGNSCLHLAASRNRSDVADCLLSLDMPVDEPGRNGMTPLMLACEVGHLKVAQLLHSKGANLAASDTQGYNCLNHAAMAGRDELVAWLLEQGVSTENSLGDHFSPLMSAFVGGHWKTVEVLITNGARFNFLISSTEHLGSLIMGGAFFGFQYGVLQALMVREWPVPSAWCGGYIQTVGIELAKVHDLRRFFWGGAQPDQLLDPVWLSSAKNPDRKEFIDYYLKYFFTPDSDNFTRLLEPSSLSSHPFFSCTIHHHLKHQLGDPPKFYKALAGEDMPAQAAQQKNVLLFKLQALRQTLQIPAIFQERHLSPASYTTISNVLTQQTSILALAASERAASEQTELPGRLAGLCKKYLGITGQFSAAAFKKALAKHLGFYGVNADRLTVLVGQAWETVCRRPVDLPSIASINQAVSLSGQQAIDSLFAELRKMLMESARAYEPIGAEYPERLFSGDDDGYPGLSAQLKPSLRHAPEPSMLPGFMQGLDGLAQREQDLYADLIFAQWRQINAALGVSLPQVFVTQQ